MKAVLDTNVLISAVFWKGPPNLILQLAEKGLIAIIISEDIIEEFLAVISREKFSPYIRQSGYTPKEIARKIISLAQVIKPTELISGAAYDPADNKFLSCAVSAQAAFLVSGDHHLLSLKKFRNVTIATPTQFLKYFSKKK